MFEYLLSSWELTKSERLSSREGGQGAEGGGGIEPNASSLNEERRLLTLDDWSLVEPEVSIGIPSADLGRMFEISGSEGGELLLLLGSEPLFPSLRFFLSLDI